MERVAKDLLETVRLAVLEMERIDEATVSYRPQPDRWTIKQVIGHLLDSAANNHQRFVRAQFVKELEFPKYDQNEWVEAQDYDTCRWIDLIEFWLHYNRHIAHIILRMPAESLAVSCRVGDGEPVSLEFLINDYVDHLKHHLRKVAERIGAEWSFAK